MNVHFGTFHAWLVQMQAQLELFLDLIASRGYDRVRSRVSLSCPALQMTHEILLYSLEEKKCAKEIDN